MDRRTALVIVAGILTRSQAQAQDASRTCREPETLVLNLGSGACTIHHIRVQLGALSATIPTTELLAALGAKVGA